MIGSNINNTNMTVSKERKKYEKYRELLNILTH